MVAVITAVIAKRHAYELGMNPYKVKGIVDWAA